jgi:hypothetical protein
LRIFLTRWQYIRTIAARLNALLVCSDGPRTVQNSPFVTLEIGQLAFHEAKAYTKQSLCRILLFQGNQYRDAIGNNRLAKCNKRQGLNPI